MSALIQGAIQLGLSTVLVIFFVWHGQRREVDLRERATRLENSLLSILQYSTATIEKHTHIMRDLVEAVRESNHQVSILLGRIGECPQLLHAKDNTQ